jgi:hypothetical protein
VELACTSGKVKVEVGDRFRDPSSGIEWEIVGFKGHTYSPVGIGGTPVVACKPLADILPVWWRQWLEEPDGTVDWCGDSVAAILKD